MYVKPSILYSFHSRVILVELISITFTNSGLGAIGYIYCVVVTEGLLSLKVENTETKLNSYNCPASKPSRTADVTPLA